MTSHILLDKVASLSKFRGALVGALLGDCLGVPFEGDDRVSKIVLQKYFDKMEEPTFKSPLKKFSDDSMMTKAIAESLVDLKSFDELDVAKRFVRDYFSEPDRGYGEGVVTVFRKLKNTKFQDVWLPAREQFGGSGSLGNGGAMRIAPLALFYWSDYPLMLAVAGKCTRLTHTHRLGVNGALLQATAIYEALLQDPSQGLDVEAYLSKLIEKMSNIEAVREDEIDFVVDERSYGRQLKAIQSLLKKEDPSDDEVIEILGNGVQAYYSVPTAIYAFLRAQRSIQSVQTENKFRRTLQYSISLGGDTDTIASMAGALSGAYHGYEIISQPLQNHCEGLSRVLDLAQKLHESVPS